MVKYASLETHGTASVSLFFGYCNVKSPTFNSSFATTSLCGGGKAFAAAAAAAPCGAKGERGRMTPRMTEGRKPDEDGAVDDNQHSRMR